VVHRCEPNSADGTDRRAPDLQAFGAWSQPTATEFFTTLLSHVSADGQSTFPASEGNYSPASQVSGQNGELIGPETAACEASRRSLCVTQVVDRVVVAKDRKCEPPVAES
jgi:hypothetical protein